MAEKWLEPPEWWRKWKPLRWLFAIVVIWWLLATFLPRYQAESEAPAPVQPAEPEIVAAAPVEPAATPVTPSKPEPVVPKPTPPAPTPAPPKPIVKPAPAVVAPVAPVVKPATPAPKPTPPVPQAKAEPPSAVKPAAKPVEAIEPADPAARFTAVAPDRVVFMNVLRSYDSVDAVNEQLQKAGFSAATSTIEKKVNTSRYPPFRSDTLLVQSYQHAGHEGKLTLEFFNDRLYEAQFIPKDPRDYLAWLRTHRINLARKPSGRSSFNQGHLQVVSNIDFATSDVGRSLPTAPFVLWEDLRLVQQMRDWGPLR